MPPDAYSDMFRFTLGQCVRWTESPYQRHWVGQRRWTEREILAPLVQYRLRFGKPEDGPLLEWARQEDLTPWEDGT